eukprot:scaffold109_cov252-Pinguiococcus_pyrenoidosus.AAC.106
MGTRRRCRSPRSRCIRGGGESRGDVPGLQLDPAHVGEGLAVQGGAHVPRRQGACPEADKATSIAIRRISERDRYEVPWHDPDVAILFVFGYAQRVMMS